MGAAICPIFVICPGIVLKDQAIVQEPRAVMNCYEMSARLIEPLQRMVIPEKDALLMGPVKSYSY
jgi:hypothetical protein